MSLLLERILGSLLGIGAFSLITLPYYFISKKYFPNYPLPIASGLSTSFTIVKAYLLQLVSLISIFPLTLLFTYLLAYRYGEFSFEYDKTILSLLGMGFILRWTPNFFKGEVPNYLVPSGYDQQHHLYLTKLISETGTIPETWQAGYNLPIYYNPGFALLSASVSKIPLIKPIAVLYSVPFILSASFGLMLYPVCKELGFKRRYAIFSSVSIIFGSYSTFAFHGFGGYAQLTSMIGMITSLVFFLRYRKERNLGNILGFIAGTVAMGLSHYYVAIFMAIFYGLYILKERSINSIIDIGLPGTISVLITAPWLLHVLLSVPESTTRSLISLNSLTPTFNPIHKILLSLGPFTVGIAALYHKRSNLDIYAAWASIVLLLSQTAALGFYILIGSRWWYGAILPVGVLTASGSKQVYENYLSEYISFKTLLIAFLVVNMIGVSFLYTYRYNNNLRSVTMEDYQTFEYIESELPEDILIHDADMTGGWILPITGRNITTPFIPVPPKKVVESSNKYQELYNNRRWAELEEKGVDYYFIGEMNKVPGECRKVYKSLYNCG